MTTMTEFFWMAIFVLLPAKSPALHLQPLTLALLAALKWFCILSIESIPTIIIKFMYSTITHISHHITIWFVSNSSGQIPGRAIGRKPKNTQLSKALAAWRTGHGVLAGLSRGKNLCTGVTVTVTLPICYEIEIEKHAVRFDFAKVSEHSTPYKFLTLLSVITHFGDIDTRLLGVLFWPIPLR